MSRQDDQSSWRSSRDSDVVEFRNRFALSLGTDDPFESMKELARDFRDRGWSQTDLYAVFGRQQVLFPEHGSEVAADAIADTRELLYYPGHLFETGIVEPYVDRTLPHNFYGEISSCLSTGEPFTCVLRLAERLASTGWRTGEVYSILARLARFQEDEDDFWLLHAVSEELRRKAPRLSGAG